MLHDIAPNIYSREFQNRTCEDSDFIIYIKTGFPVLKKENNTFRFPYKYEVNHPASDNSSSVDFKYLFSIDDMHFYLYISELEAMLTDDFIVSDRQLLRTLKPACFAFAGALGSQLYRYYMSNRYCGKCGSRNIFNHKEHAMACSKCNIVSYPKISPAIIVAIGDGDRLLLTRYRNGSYNKYALVAGFVEVGETFEQAVVREVHEEVGLNIRNIRYYGNQPWPFSDSQMIGFTAELDGDDHITLQEDELSEAKWLSFDEIPEYPVNKASIGEELIERFKISRAKYILFDLDGTLTDPREGITKCVQYALERFGIQVSDLNDLVCFIGPPLYESFPDYYGLSEEETMQAVTYYRERFDDVGLFENIVYPGIASLLEALVKAGYILAVATSKPERASIRILEHFDLLKYFTTVVGSELDGSRSKKADVIKEVFKRLDINEELKKRCVMVGDRKHDIIGAQENGICSIGVEYGYAEPGELRNAGASLVVDSVRRLGEIFLS